MNQTTTPAAFVIRDARRAGYVTRYATDVQRVQVTNDPKMAQRFPTADEARQFIDLHSHHGSGLVARSAFVQPLTH